MNRLTYNIAMAFGLALVTAGSAMLSLPIALVTTGGLVIVLTALGAWLESR